MKKGAVTILRPFETDYAGAWRGHCKTRESAIMAAMRHCVMDAYTRATITDVRNGEIVARVRLTDDRKSAVVETTKPMRKIR